MSLGLIERSVRKVSEFSELFLQHSQSVLLFTSEVRVMMHGFCRVSCYYMLMVTVILMCAECFTVHLFQFSVEHQGLTNQTQ